MGYVIYCQWLVILRQGNGSTLQMTQHHNLNEVCDKTCIGACYLFHTLHGIFYAFGTRPAGQQ